MDTRGLNVTLIVAFISSILLFWRGRRANMFRQYPLIYLYITANLAYEVLAEVFARHFGLQSKAFTAAYGWISIGVTAVGICVLLHIYYLGHRRSVWDWHIFVFVALMLTRGFFWSSEVWVSYRLLVGLQMLRAYLGLSAFLRLFSSRVLPGWNLTIALLAMTLPPAFQSFILAHYLFGANPLSYEFANAGLEASGSIAWVILVVGLWDYSPPAAIRLPRGLAPDAAKARVWANIRALWNSR